MTVPTLGTARQKLLAAALAALATFVGYLVKDFVSGPPAPAPTPAAPGRVESHRPPPHGFGWVNSPAAVRAVAATLPSPRFADTEAFRAAPDGPDDVYLWDACRKATGDLLPARDQGQVGCCVGFGTASAVEHLICVQIASGAGESYQDVAQEVVYGGSRVEIGGGRLRGDGSVGAWAAQFVQKYGIVPRGRYGSLDLTKYSEGRCRQLGDAGLSAALEAVARDHPVKTISNVQTWDEAKAAIRNGYPVAVCSDQGFGMRRDADGFCPPQGSWAHCMALVGVCGGKRPGGFLLNSWGPAAHTGPGGAGNPSPAGFWADAAVLDRMVRQGDSWAFSGFTGFPARNPEIYYFIADIGGLFPALSRNCHGTHPRSPRWHATRPSGNAAGTACT